MKNGLFPTAMVFDWDNTLVDSWGAIAETINDVRVKFGLPQWTMKEIMANCTRAARDSFPEWFGPDWKRAYELYYKGFDEIRKKRSITALNGAAELLIWLGAQKIPAFVVSNKRGDYLRIEAEKLGWQKHFVALAGAQDAPRDKPAREHLDHALAKGGLTASEAVWFIGDSESDVLCARNAGCTPVLVGASALAKTLKVELSFADCAALQKLLITRLNDKVT